jgi:hypothetical protein
MYMPETARKQSIFSIFSIFSCGCKQYKFVHVNSVAKVQLNFELRKKNVFFFQRAEIISASRYSVME